MKPKTKQPEICHPDICIDLIKTVYRLSDNKFCIYAEIHHDSSITLKTNSQGDTFCFQRSKPEIALAIIRLMSEAVTLTDTVPRKSEVAE